jgi:anti-sigma factor RsiW
LSTEAIAPTPVVQTRLLPLPVRLVALVGPVLAALWLVIALAIPAVRSNGDLRRELVATHVLFAHDESMLDVEGDGPVVAAWFWDAAGLQVSAPPLDGYTLVGGRLVAFEGRPVAQLVYEGRSEEVYLSLLQFHDNARTLVPLPPSDDVTFHQQGPISLATWVSGEERVALAGMVPPDELRRLADDLTARSKTSPPRA